MQVTTLTRLARVEMFKVDRGTYKGLWMWRLVSESHVYGPFATRSQAMDHMDSILTPKVPAQLPTTDSLGNLPT